MRSLVSYFILMMVCSFTFAQPGKDAPDEQLAVHYYQSGQYDKALVYYEKLFNKKPIDLYYNYYIDCLIQTKDLKKAEKVIRKQIKNHPYDLSYRVDIGNIYKSQEEFDKAKKEYNLAISELTPNQEQITELANAFINAKEFDLAIETYVKAKKLMQGFYTYNFELAEVYGLKKDYPAMINQYLDALSQNEGYWQQVQNELQNKFPAEGDEKKSEILKGEILRRIQKEPNKTIFSELLLFILMQQKDYDAAFVQAKALDKRKNESGTRLMSLAQTALSTGNYDMAIKSYQYVISLGPDKYYYIDARKDLLQALSKKIFSTNNYSQADLKELENNYVVTIQELGKSALSANLMKDLAHLKAFYLDQVKEAAAMLEEVIALPQISPVLAAEAKLELGDILLLQGDIWEASLKYSQVEKAYKHDIIGQEAKFRNARVAYYTGDFKWAQAQLDVLKGATSKLIANDAMDLSLLITDNMGIDTNAAPMLMFARADLLAFRNKYEDAFKTLDSLTKEFPSHALADDILMKRAQIKIKSGKHEEAVNILQELLDKHGTDILGDDALFKLAELYHFNLNNKEKAMELYQDLLTKYPGSLFTVEARKRFRTLRGDNIK